MSDGPRFPVDRWGPTQRPNLPIAGYHRWYDLLFLHWQVDAEELRRQVPPPLELDLWQGQAFVGVVAFAMDRVRPYWWPSWCSLRFLETNVRTYVTCQGVPGIYFFSLDANHFPAVVTARLGWGLPYFPAAISYSVKDGMHHYHARRWCSEATLDVAYRVGNRLGASTIDSLQFFFLERYILFVRRGTGWFAGQVYHTPYPAYQAELASCKQTLVESAGLHTGGRAPDYVHFSTGVDVEVFELQRIPAFAWSTLGQHPAHA